MPGYNLPSDLSQDAFDRAHDEMDEETCEHGEPVSRVCGQCLEEIEDAEDQENV